VPTADYGAGLIDKCNGMAFSELLDQRLLASVSLDGVVELSAICGSLRHKRAGDPSEWNVISGIPIIQP
jgi:hypothetical protein